MTDALQELARYVFSAFRPPERLTVSEWADKYRILASESSAEPGKWRTNRAPYQREIMNAFTQPGVWEIVVMASSQSGKTEAINNMVGYAIDTDPGPMLYVQPTEKTAEDYSKRRIAPMIASTPRLRDKVFRARSRDSANTITMKTFPGGSLAIVGANSPADLASKPVRYLFMDETDRFPVSAGTEGDPQKLAERRTETFRHNRKIVKTSSPTIKGRSPIERDFMTGTQEEWHTECPYCHEYSFIRFQDIHFEKDEFKNETGEVDYTVRDAVWRCPVCKHDTPEHKTKRLPAKWVSKNPDAINNGIRSFHLNAFMSPWSDWRDICWNFLKAHKDPELLKVFYNTILGESWEVHTSNGLEEKLYKQREHYDAEVPSGVLLLTMGIDTQDNRLEYEVVGWDRNGQSWGISRGIIPGRADAKGVWDEVDDLLDREWNLANGMKMRILATFIDSGGHFTQDIYKQCSKRQSKRIWPIKGEGGEGKQYCRQMRHSTAGDSGIKFIIGVDDGKSAIMYEAGIKEPGAHYMHFPMDRRAGYDMEFFRGLISERMVIHRSGGKSVIAWEKTRERNEPLDCRNYARAAYRFFNWNFDALERTLAGEETQAIVTQKEVEKRQARHIVSRGIQI